MCGKSLFIKGVYREWSVDLRIFYKVVGMVIAMYAVKMT